MGMINGEPPNLFHRASIYRSSIAANCPSEYHHFSRCSRDQTVTSGVRGDSPREKSGGFNISLDIKPVENQSAFVSGQIIKQSFKIFKFRLRNSSKEQNQCTQTVLEHFWYYLLLMEIIKEKMIKKWPHQHGSTGFFSGNFSLRIFKGWVCAEALGSHRKIKATTWNKWSNMLFLPSS